MSVLATNDTINHYYSGQGVVMIGTRNATTGAGEQLLPLGNVSDLKITLNASVNEHKNSQDGQRAVDSRLQTDLKGNLSMTIDNWIANNLAKALRGLATTIDAGSVSAVAYNAFVGGSVTPLPHLKISSLVVTQATTNYSAGAMTEYVNDSTPWDYKWNSEAGSFKLNSGTEAIGPVKAGIALTGSPVATIAGNSVPITGLTAWGGASVLAVGDSATIWGVTGAGAATVNGKLGTVTAVSATTLTMTVPGSAGAVVLSTSCVVVPVYDLSAGAFFSQQVTVAYSYATQKRVDALTKGITEVYLRFEGLNTAEGNDPVVVEVYRVASDPLKELSLLSDTYGSFTLEGSVLADALRPSGTSRYFHVMKMN